MQRFDHAGCAGTNADHDVVAAEASSAAFDAANISTALDQAFEIEEIDFPEIEDDLLSLIAKRPSQRARNHYSRPQ